MVLTLSHVPIMKWNCSGKPTSEQSVFSITTEIIINPFLTAQEPGAYVYTGWGETDFHGTNRVCQHPSFKHSGITQDLRHLKRTNN
eukprot:scaffold14035_cov55-Attheya_sp.AAC.8